MREFITLLATACRDPIGSGPGGTADAERRTDPATAADVRAGP